MESLRKLIGCWDLMNPKNYFEEFVDKYFDFQHRRHYSAKRKPMKRTLLAKVVFLYVSSGIALSRPLEIPVIPYDDKPPYISYKIHKRCKLHKNYWKCIDRSDQKVTTSIDMDY